jgi:surface protein
MGQIATVVQRLGSSPGIVVTRIKDRFLTSPSGGGWRDCMLNFYLKADSNQHVCEVQLVHGQMMTARKGLPGHAVYNRVRNADELVNQWMDKEQPQTKKETQEWLVGWQKGDKCARGPPNLWDVRKVTDMSGLFDHEELREFNDPIGDWDVRNVVNMEKMFKNAESFNQPIGGWRTENVTTMEQMFYYAKSFNQPIGEWRTENVTIMKEMFCDAESFNQPIGEWRTEKVTTMEWMFLKAESFNQPIGQWRTENVTTMENMFKDAHAMEEKNKPKMK